jgi:hypothetical protein
VLTRPRHVAQVLALRQRGINANYLASTQMDRRASKALHTHGLDWLSRAPET